MSKTEQVTSAQALTAIYEQLLQPSFPQHELAPIDHLVEMVQSGRGYVLAVPEVNAYAGVAVVEYHTAQIDLLSYLAVGVAGRSKGYGSVLLDAVREQTARRGWPFLLAEIEMPDAPEQPAAYGDSRRRAAFYDRAGAKAVAMSHWQPAAAAGFQPVRLTLIAIPAANYVPQQIPASQLRAFEVEYHGTSTTAELTETLSSLSKATSVELLDLKELYRL